MTLENRVRSVVLAKSSAVDLVTVEIRRLMITGALPAGKPFSIRGLAAQLGVSHIPVREALRGLEARGLIVLRQGHAARVASLSSSDLEAIYRLRYLIEVPLAGASAGMRSPDQVARLRELLEVTRDHDPEIAWHGHHDFHEALVHPAASAWDDRVLCTLWMAAEQFTYLVFDPTRITSEERDRRYEAHQLLLEAALTGSHKAMADSLLAHLAADEHQILTHSR